MNVRFQYECTKCEAIGEKIVDMDTLAVTTSGMIQRGILETSRTTITEVLEHINDITCTGCGGTDFCISEPADA